jgi:hypothetical protein
MRINTEELFGTNAPPSTDVRVRYSYDLAEEIPKLKNTLLSFIQDGRIFFGIARCNLDAGDRFNRKVGRGIAVRRALSALDKYKEAPLHELALSMNFLSGCCKVEAAKKMVEHFKSIDTIIMASRQSRYAKLTKAA